MSEPKARPAVYTFTTTIGEAEVKPPAKDPKKKEKKPKSPFLELKAKERKTFFF